MIPLRKFNSTGILGRAKEEIVSWPLNDKTLPAGCWFS